MVPGRSSAPICCRRIRSCQHNISNVSLFFVFLFCLVEVLPFDGLLNEIALCHASSSLARRRRRGRRRGERGQGRESERRGQGGFLLAVAVGTALVAQHLTKQKTFEHYKLPINLQSVTSSSWSFRRHVSARRRRSSACVSATASHPSSMRTMSLF
jgi:hypothetical protein